MRRLPAGLVLTLALAGCGVTTEAAPRDVNPPRGPFSALAASAAATPAAVPSGSVDEQLFFIRDSKLVAVTRHVDIASTAQELVDALEAGPTETERTAGLSTALGGTDVISAVTLTGDRAELALTSPVDSGTRSDVVLAYAQLVCTLTARADITTVVFTQDGTAVGVPRGDLSLSDGPLTAADYSVLIAG